MADAHLPPPPDPVEAPPEAQQAAAPVDEPQVSYSVKFVFFPCLLLSEVSYLVQFPVYHHSEGGQEPREIVQSFPLW